MSRPRVDSPGYTFHNITSKACRDVMLQSIRPMKTERNHFSGESAIFYLQYSAFFKLFYAEAIAFTLQQILTH